MSDAKKIANEIYYDTLIMNISQARNNLTYFLEMGDVLESVIPLNRALNFFLEHPSRGAHTNALNHAERLLNEINGSSNKISMKEE